MYNEVQLAERFSRLENLLLLQKKKLTLKEAALYTGYKESYIYKLTASKQIPHSKPGGGAIFFDREELEEWLSRNKVKTNEEIEKEANMFKIK
jgi:excisionase family DNA binding protein